MYLLYTMSLLYFVYSPGIVEVHFKNSHNDFVVASTIPLETKKVVFDKTMLLSRLQEEDGILIKEMRNHCRYLTGSSKAVKREIHQIEEDLSKHSRHLTETLTRLSIGMQRDSVVTNVYNSHTVSLLLFS